jgi:hypothetical protein
MHMTVISVPGFLPSTSGFHFSNIWPIGTAYPVLNLPVLGAVTGDAGNGICGGFVFAALDLFLHDPRQAPPANTEVDRPQNPSPIFDYLVERLVDSWGTPGQGLDANAARVVEWITTPGHDVTISFYGAGLARRMIELEWPKIKADIDGGMPSPLNLVGGPERGRADFAGTIDSLHHCHQVLAYAYELDGAGNLVIWVYDCNDPADDQSTLTMNIAGDPRQTMAISGPSIEANMSGGMEIRGIFRSHYEPRDPSNIEGFDWKAIGHANGVVGMAATNGKLFAATSDNRLWARDPVLGDVNWQHIGHANGVVGMAAISGKLFAATSDNRLWARDPVLSDVGWQHIGHANGVVGMAAVAGKLFVATSDDLLWARDPVLADVNWQPIGHANHVVAMTAVDGRLVCATKDDRLWARDPVLADIGWQDIGPTHDVVGLAGLGDLVFAATAGNELVVRRVVLPTP